MTCKNIVSDIFNTLNLWLWAIYASASNQKIKTLLLPLIILSSATSSNTAYANDDVQEHAFNQQVDKTIALSLVHLESGVALIKDPTLFPTYANKELLWNLNTSHKWTTLFYSGTL